MPSLYSILPWLLRKGPLFYTLKQADLFSNEFDLSLHIDGRPSSSSVLDIEKHVRDLEDRLISNDTEDLYKIWSARLDQSRSRQHTVAIVLDNAGPEFLADFCFAEWLINSKLTERVVFCPKILPWFVSDVTESDIQWLLHVGLNPQTDDESFKKQAAMWSAQWKQRFEDGSFSVKISDFWTFPHSYGHMREVDPELYAYLSNQCDVIIFKGDYNYRKILADRTWQPDSPQHKVMAFRPMQLGRFDQLDANLNCPCSKTLQQTLDLASPFDCRCQTPLAPLVVSLRIAKSDVCVGLKTPVLNQLCAESKDWWIIGKYGLIQIVSPILLHV